MLKLHIGCGLKYKKDYVNIDSVDDTVADKLMLSYKLDFDDDTVDLIESFQLLEHLGYMKTILALGEWYRVLKENSSVVIETPDLDKTVELYLKNNDHSQKAIILNWIYGYPKQGYEHKLCFPAGILRKLLIESGFVDIMEKHHEKTFGVPSYTFIAKKPINVNKNHLLVHNLRKRCFAEIEHLSQEKDETYLLDFEKCVLGHTIDYTPKDFSIVTFSELFTNCIPYSLSAAKILVEESLKLNLMQEEGASSILDNIKVLEELNFSDYLYSYWEEHLYKLSNPEKAYVITIELAKNIAKKILFDTNNTEEFKKYVSQTIRNNQDKPLILAPYFSNLFIENALSRIIARQIKGCTSEEEKKLCKALTIEHQL